MKVIAVDFDGTLCENKFPDIGEPRLTVIKQVLFEKLIGNKVILWTCREGKYLDEALNACNDWGLTFDAVNANLPERIEQYGNDCRKVGADEYWDDRGIRV